MNETLYEFIALDVPPLLAVTLAALSCALLGNFLVLRRLSLMGDAISHAVLPGLVLAFLVTALLGYTEHARNPLVMLLGAGLSGVVAVVLIELVQRFGKLESGAAMGVVFSVMFALGVVLLEQAAVRHVDLDADCVLYGQLETIFWQPPETLGALFSIDAIKDLPRQIDTLAVVFAIVAVFVALFFKELRIASFDAGLATSQGFNASIMHYALMILVAATAVAAFEAVGSILVIALLICPAAAARLLTDRLTTQLLVSGAIALVASVGGYALGALAPLWLGFEHSLNAAGMITATQGVLLALAIVFAPAHGVLPRRLRRMRLAVSVMREDILGMLYRMEELDAGPAAGAQIREALGRGVETSLALRTAIRRREVARSGGMLGLTERGRDLARTLVRSHRLWESYLVRVLGLRPDHVHDTAMRLEHLRRGADESRLTPRLDIARDPHDRPIPGTEDDPADADEAE